MDNIDKATTRQYRKLERGGSLAIARLLPRTLVRRWAKQSGFVFRNGLYSAWITLTQCVEKQLAPKSTRAIEQGLALTARVLNYGEQKKLQRLPRTAKIFAALAPACR